MKKSAENDRAIQLRGKKKNAVHRCAQHRFRKWGGDGWLIVTGLFKMSSVYQAVWPFQSFSGV